MAGRLGGDSDRNGGERGERLGGKLDDEQAEHPDEMFDWMIL